MMFLGGGNIKSYSEVNITIKWRYEVLTLAMSANHISIPTWGKAVSWNRNGLVQWAGGVEVPFVLSCLNTLVNSCQQGSHSAKGQGHLSCDQHIDIVPFHFPLSPSSLFFYHCPLCLSLLLTVTLPRFLLFPPSSSASLPLPLLLFWWKEWICRELTWLAASYPHDGWRLLHY